MAIEHKDITDAERHAPKGASTAATGEVPVSDGAGDVVWGNPEPKGADAASEFDVYVSDGAGSGAWKKPTRMGWENYEDTATTGTPITLSPVDTFVKLTNNQLGPISNKSFKLAGGGADLWNSSTNQVDFTSMSAGDVVTIRIDVTVTTTGANHGIRIIYRFGIGGFSFDLELEDINYKSSGSHAIVRTINVFANDSNFIDNPGEILMLSDTGSANTVVVNGFFFEVISRGED